MIVYKDESLSLRSLLMKTAEKIDQDYWLNPGILSYEILLELRFIFLEPYKLGVALFVIKPDLVANGKKNEILGQVNHTNKIMKESLRFYSYVIEDLLFIQMLRSY